MSVVVATTAGNTVLGLLLPVAVVSATDFCAAIIAAIDCCDLLSCNKQSVIAYYRMSQKVFPRYFDNHFYNSNSVFSSFMGLAA